MILILLSLFLVTSARLPDNAFRQNIYEMVVHNDYLFEEYQAFTADGYILTVFRINHRQT